MLKPLHRNKHTTAEGKFCKCCFFPAGFCLLSPGTLIWIIQTWSSNQLSWSYNGSNQLQHTSTSLVSLGIRVWKQKIITGLTVTLAQVVPGDRRMLNNLDAHDRKKGTSDCCPDTWGVWCVSWGSQQDVFPSAEKLSGEMLDTFLIVILFTS